MIQKGWLVSLLLVFPLFGLAQLAPNMVEGSVAERTEDGKTAPLVGVNVYWEGTSIGTSSDNTGQFIIQRTNKTNQLVFSYIGYRNDTLEVNTDKIPMVVMDVSRELGEVEVVHRQKSTEISMLGSVKVEHIGEKELCKAACCNLSESFETSPSIDVSFTDAVTGSRQIQMLGLAGPYVQMTRENIPDMRGLASIYGLTLVSGNLD